MPYICKIINNQQRKTAMSKQDFFINAKLTVQGSVYDFQLDVEETHTLEDTLDSLQIHFDTAVHDGVIVLQDPEDSDYIDITEDMVEFDFSQIPQFLIGDWDVWDAISEFAEHYYQSSYDMDVFEAANDCDIPFKDIDECYQGEHDSDEDFVQNLCEDVGVIPKDLPSYIHIDWERTANDIMYDYAESNGHYFRNI